MILPYVPYEQLSLKGSELGGNSIIAGMQIKRDAFRYALFQPHFHTLHHKSL